MVWRRLFGGRDRDTPPEPDRSDPRVQLEEAAAAQRAQWRAARTGMAEVATARRRLELLIADYRAQVPELEAKARTALAIGREDEARRHVDREQLLLAQIEQLDEQRAQAAAHLDQLRELTLTLRDQTERLEAEKQAVLATLTAAQAQERASAALAAVPGGSEDPGALLALARSQAEQVATTASATAEVAALNQQGGAALPASSSAAVEQHMDRLRAQLPRS